MIKRLLFVHLFLIPFSLYAQNPGRPALEPIREGATKVTGSILNADGGVKVTIMRKPSSGDPISYETTLKNGIFSVDLPTPASAGDRFVATESKSNQSSEPVTVVHIKPTFVVAPMYEGMLQITGTVRNKGDNATVYVLRKSGREAAPIGAADGTFTVNLATTALIANEPLTFLLDKEPDAADMSQVVNPREATAGEEGDLGFGRYYFTAGTVISKKNDFQGADLYASFNFDKSWLGFKHTKSEDEKKAGAGAKNEPGEGEKTLKTAYLNSYFDVRLTSIPIAPGAGTDPTASTTTGSGGSSGAGTGTSGTGTASVSDQVAQSKKAALIQIGLYVPIIVAQKSFRGEPNALFIAPIGKAGIQTLTGSNVSAEGASLGGDDLYNFHAYGFRLGQFRANSENPTPQTVWYLDLTAGHWENFELCSTTYKDESGADQLKRSTCTEATTASGTPYRRYRPLRYGFEGRLKVPAMPLFMGFDINAGSGPDDVRFLFGTRFDVGDLARKIH
jgi:hypothetical protein